MLKVEGLGKSYKNKEVLRELSFTVNQGEVVGLVGENGAGKSTLLSILATVQKPTAGKISLSGISYNDQQQIRKKIGYVPQELSIWEDLSVEENMKFFSKLCWQPLSIDACQQLCQQMQLTQWKEPVSSLSGGMKRKLNMAISLIHNPDLLLLDEPTVGIDFRSKIEIGTYLVNFAKQQNKIVIYTSHDMNEIESFCDWVYVIGEDPFYMDLLSGRDVITKQL